MVTPRGTGELSLTRKTLGGFYFVISSLNTTERNHLGGIVEHCHHFLPSLTINFIKGSRNVLGESCHTEPLTSVTSAWSLIFTPNNGKRYAKL